MSYRQKIGEFGEKLAKNYLLRKQYKILETNLRVGHKEVDILAKFNKKLIFVEVKTRLYGDSTGADEAVDENKINYLTSALSQYVYAHGYDPEAVRLDLIAITLNKVNNTANIKHYKDIF